MPTTTRAKTYASNPSTHNNGEMPLECSGSESGSESDIDNIEVQISKVQKHVKNVRRDLESLRKRNKELEHELLHQNKPTPPKRGKKGSTDAGLNTQITKLQKEVKRLEKARAKDKEKIEKLRMKELKAEAAELEGGEQGHANADGDSVHRMRKLLRRFSDLMLETSLPDDGENCPVCFEPMELGKSFSLPCQHFICETCLPRISRGSDETVLCPECRRRSPRDELESIQFTASEQWDALLDVAKAWAAFDRRGEDETSEEEAEEEFIDEDDTSSEPSNKETLEDEVSQRSPSGSRSPGPSNHDPSTPPPGAPSSLSYSQSPTKKKRERMENLAQNRQKKRRC